MFFLSLSAFLFSFTAQAVVGGISYANEWKYTVLINDDCSGILVHKRMVLTAGHCVRSMNMKNEWIGVEDKVSFYDQNGVRVAEVVPKETGRRVWIPNEVNNVQKTIDETDLAPATFKRVDSGSVWRHYDYVEGRVGHPDDKGMHLLAEDNVKYLIDFGILILSEDAPKGFDPVAVMKGRLTDPGSIQTNSFLISGMGQAINPGTEHSSPALSGEHRYIGYGTTQAGEQPVVYFFDSSHPGREACEGDSGGPVTKSVDGQPVLVGVYLAGFTTNCGNGGIAAAINLYSHNIEANIRDFGLSEAGITWVEDSKVFTDR